MLVDDSRLLVTDWPEQNEHDEHNGSYDRGLANQGSKRSDTVDQICECEQPRLRIKKSLFSPVYTETQPQSFCLQRTNNINSY